MKPKMAWSQGLAKKPRVAMKPSVARGAEGVVQKPGCVAQRPRVAQRAEGGTGGRGCGAEAKVNN